MQKNRYRFHPDDYALGETEKFYSDMEKKGWRLVKRGSHLSKFTPCEPSAARYRVEVTSAGFMENTNLSEEQIMVYADCGWDHVTSCGLLHIFRAPAGSDAPEFYEDPRQQAATLKKLRRQYYLSWLPIAIYLFFMFTMTAAIWGDVNKVLRQSAAELQQKWICLTAFQLVLLGMILFGGYGMIRGAVCIGRTYRRMKKGIPLDHAPRGRQILHKVIHYGLLSFIGISALLTLWQVVNCETGPLPVEADGPYLLLRDLGYQGERTYLAYSDNESQRSYTESLLTELWETKEAVGKEKSPEAWIYQDIYRLKNIDDTEKLVEVLKSTATFGDPESYHPVEFPGLDGVWTTRGLEIIAYKDDMVGYLTCASGMLEGDGLEKTLTALAECWARSE